MRRYYREGFEVRDKVYFNPRSSNKQNIDTSLGKKDFEPRVTKINDNVVVYSAYAKASKNSEEIQIILNALKGKSKYKVEIDPESYELFIKRTSFFFWHLVKDFPIDTIITIESSSGLSDDLKNSLLDRLPYDIIEYDEGVKKNLDFASYWIETEKISPESLKKIQSDIRRMEKSGYFKIHEINLTFRRFVRNWLKIDEDVREGITGKNVLIIDDFLTSGTTMREAVRLISDVGANKIWAITILK